MSKLQREFVLWGGIATAAVLAFIVILRLQYANTQNRWAIAVTPQPALGSAVFQSKGCARCHGDAADGRQVGPPLRQRPASLPQLVTAMWNHAPRMYEAMNHAKLPYPKMSYDETGQLVAYLYLAGYSDEPGDINRGKQLFVTKNCARCHTRVVNALPVTELAHSDSPLSWTQSLWNHAAAMEDSMQRLGIAWPHFQANELRDMFAYVRSEAAGRSAEAVENSADPDRGWQVFQSKYCINCHALRIRNAAGESANSQNRRVGPALGTDGKLPPTFSQFGEAMLNHFPNMHRAMREVGQKPPVFESQEFADVALFLYTLQYQEPSGSPHVGASVFTWRGCADCHGARGEGTSRGPGLRGRGQPFTSVRLATSLWQHGASMYEQSRKSGRSWPTLQETDVGDLLAFLNTPVPQK